MLETGAATPDQRSGSQAAPSDVSSCPVLSQCALVPWTSSSATTRCASPWPGSATGKMTAGITRMRTPRSAVS